MAITSTPKLGLPQWGQGSDSPSRAAFNAAFAAIEAAAAIDYGEAGGTTLPGSNVVTSRYAPVINGSYRQLFRRSTTGWTQVGGNTWAETQYERADAALPTTGATRIVSHPSLTNATITENWDGSSIRGGRQAYGDLNSGAVTALHVGDTTSAVDLTVRGRVFAYTAGNGGRGVVAAAHAAAAGNLFTARDASGSEPWTIDSAGRMRAQAPAAFGAATTTTNVPLISSPGTNDLTAADLIAATGKPALRLFRAPGDLIGQVLPDAITFGKAGWTGGSFTVTAPTIALAGVLGITGATSIAGATAITGSLTVSSTLGVSGTTTLAGLAAGSTSITGTLGVSGTSSLAAVTATTIGATGAVTAPSVTASGTVQGQNVSATSQLSGASASISGAASVGSLASSGSVSGTAINGSSVTATGSVSAEGGKVTTATSGSGAIVSSRPPVQNTGTAAQSLRASATSYRSAAVNVAVPTVGAGEATVDMAFVMPEDGWLRVDYDALFNVDLGLSGSLETFKAFLTLELRSTSTTIETAADHVFTTTTDDTSRRVDAQQSVVFWDLFAGQRLTAGNYVMRVHFSRAGILNANYARHKFLFTAVMLHSSA